MRKKNVVLGVMIAILGSLSITHAQTTTTAVIGTGTAASCTEKTLNSGITQAIADKKTKITFNCGTEIKTIKLTKQIWIPTSLTIDGGKKIILDGGNTTRHFVVARTDTKQGILAGVKGTTPAITFTLQNIALINGGGGNIPQNSRPNRGTPTTTIINKRDGGSIYVGWEGKLSLNGVVFYNNKVSGTRNAVKAPDDVHYAGGAIYASNGVAITIANSYFGKNSSTDEGGAIFASYQPTLTITNTVFENNTTVGMVPNALGGGGALYYAKATQPVVVSGSFFINNSSQRAGGAIKLLLSTTTITNTYFVENTGANGGAIYNLLSPLTVNKSYFLKNKSVNINDIKGAGGAIYFDGVGAVDKAGTTTISGSIFDGNVSYLGGGALSVCLYLNQTATYKGNIYANNVSQTYPGGGIYGECKGSHTISNNSFFKNLVASQPIKQQAAMADAYIRDSSKTKIGWNVTNSKTLTSFVSPTYTLPTHYARAKPYMK